MNDVPLVKANNIHDINTSIIAIKKQLKQLNEAVGLIDMPTIDTSIFVKKSEVVDVVEEGNMNPVTSNAVANSIGKVENKETSFNITTGNAYNYSGYYTIPKGTYIIIAHFDHGGYNIDLSYSVEGSALFAPTRNAVVNNGLNGGMVQVSAVLKSDGTKQIRGAVYPYGTVTISTCLFYFALVKIAD